jgi:uncharacterized protein YbjT (DUF2867 family)
MTPILVTGATGTLGRRVVAQLRAAGQDVRALSRRTGPDLVTGDLLTGAGIADALAGVSTVLHLATGRNRKDPDLARTLLAAAERAGAGHLIFISIVGVDDLPIGYYRDRVTIERLVAGSPVPDTILRATQFHQLVRGIFAAQRALPVTLAPRIRLQPIRVEEVATRLVELAGSSPAGRVPDIGGPQQRWVVDLARAWRAAMGSRRPVVPVRLPGRTFARFRAGHQLVMGPPYGRGTFEEYLAERGLRSR